MNHLILIQEQGQFGSRSLTVVSLFQKSPPPLFEILATPVVTNDSLHLIYPILFLSDLTDHYSIAYCVTGDPNRTNLKIKQDNHYCYRDTGQFNCD